MPTTVIYGGTFNPIHNGHLSLIEHLMSTGEYDNMLLIPAASPPHKDAPQLADGKHRLAMCRLATAHLGGVRVLDWEVARGGRSYTVDTVKYLRDKYPDDSLCLLIGTDMFLTFDQWREWQLLGSLVKLLVASREQDDIGAIERQVQHFASMGIHSQIIRNPVVVASSTEIRHELAQNGYSSLLPAGVMQYCKEYELYGCFYDLDRLRAIIKPMLKPERYQHSICVEQRAVELAGIHGGNSNKAAAAGILHDICKNMSNHVLLQIVQSCDTITDIDFEAQPQLLHSHAGALYVKQELGIVDSELLDAIRYHTTARVGMSHLEKIIYLADLTSSERDYHDAHHLRRLSDSSLDDGMLYALEYIAERHLPDKGQTPCRDTLEALNEYRNTPKI